MSDRALNRVVIDQKEFVRHLRQCQNTYEDLLWQLLRNRKRCNKKFRRLHTIGIYVADFYCAEEQLIKPLIPRPLLPECGAKGSSGWLLALNI